MTPAATVLLLLAGLTAVGNWASRITADRRLELLTKPLTMVALIGAAVALDPSDPTVRAWFVAGLCLSLAGDVFLLGDERGFLPGLASFLLAHVAYVVGLVAADPWRWWALAIAAIPIAALVALPGRRIVRGATARAPALRAPVVAYLVVISTMLLVAAAAGNGWAVAGAASFVVSDAILGWNRFVGTRPWMSVAIMVTYHLAQAGLVVSLV